MDFEDLDRVNSSPDKSGNSQSHDKENCSIIHHGSDEDKLSKLLGVPADLRGQKGD
jgi:hypothetical protein